MDPDFGNPEQRSELISWEEAADLAWREFWKGTPSLVKDAFEDFVSLEPNGPESVAVVFKNGAFVAEIDVPPYRLRGNEPEFEYD